LKYYQLGEGNLTVLYQKPSNANATPCRVVKPSGTINTIKEIHIELNRTGGKKTPQATNGRFYGVNKKEVE